MKPTFCLLLVSSLATLGATEEQINKRFNAQPRGTLIVEVDFGNVEIKTNATSQVTVDVWRQIGRGTKAQEETFLKENPVEFVQDGNTVTVRSRHHNTFHWSFLNRNSNEAKYTITVPSLFSARVETGAGGASLTDLTGDFKVRSGGGGVNAADCDGTLTLRSGGGGIDVVGGSGGGSVAVKRFHGPTHVRSGGGGLHLEGIQGELEGSTGGGGINAILSSEISGGVNLSTGGGGIHVEVPATAAFNLDAATSGGSVSSDLEVATKDKKERGRLRGPVNGGGQAVVLRTGGGGISISKL